MNEINARSILGKSDFPRYQNEVICSIQCIQGRHKARMDQKRWDAKWVNSCTKCNGAGGEEFHDDPGDKDCSLGSGSMIDFEYCECIERGECPRCGLMTNEDPDIFDEYMKCRECDWNWGKGKDDIRPDDQECHCYENSYCNICGRHISDCNCAEQEEQLREMEAEKLAQIEDEFWKEEQERITNYDQRLNDYVENYSKGDTK